MNNAIIVAIYALPILFVISERVFTIIGGIKKYWIIKLPTNIAIIV